MRYDDDYDYNSRSSRNGSRRSSSSRSSGRDYDRDYYDRDYRSDYGRSYDYNRGYSDRNRYSDRYDTRSSRDLTGTLIADIVLQLLSYVAQKERESIRQRQAEGIAAARDRGVRFGRPEKAVPDHFHLLYERWKNGEISGREAARQLGVTHQTFFKWASQRS